jgi:hypothetical protein
MQRNDLEGYEKPDEELSYSELKDRTRKECAMVLPARKRILLMAKKLEDGLTLKDTICHRICADLGDVTSERWIRGCLPAEYKQQKKRRKQSTSDLRNNSANTYKNVLEQRAMPADANTGQEEKTPLGGIARPIIMLESGKVKILDELANENEALKRENRILKEKSLLELFKELNEKFHDQPGIIDAKKLQKISMEAGKDLEKLVQKCNVIIKDAVGSGQPVPVGTYIMTKPGMKLVPVRIFVDFKDGTVA